jgi:NAD(P)-dependent dehydrogenase (short-subunit alcohol dehydrogenase family)
MRKYQMTDTSKVWFITGIARGFGKSLTDALLAKGDRVIGTTRNGDAAGYRPSANLQVLPLEITDPKAVSKIVAQAHALHGRLDVIVNNAGYGLLGSIEAATEEEVGHLFDVNFHGTRRVVQAVLPFLRKQRSGHIVNITSIAGIAPGAAAGFYAASKFAVEGMTQSLAQEVAPLGIKVTLVEPGAFRTDFLSDHSLRATVCTIDDYAPTVGAGLSRLYAMAGKQIGDPVLAAAAIIAAVTAAEPPLHLLLGSDALQRSRDKIAKFSAEIERWSATTLSTDFKQEQKA